MSALSKKFKFELNRDGVKELLKSSEMQDVISGHANQVQNAAGNGYGSEMTIGKNRCWATVRAETPHAYYSNLKNNTLLKALGGSGK